MENKYMSKEQIAKAVDGIAEEAINELKTENLKKEYVEKLKNGQVSQEHITKLMNSVKDELKRERRRHIIGTTLITAAVCTVAAIAYRKFKK